MGGDIKILLLICTLHVVCMMHFIIIHIHFNFLINYYQVAVIENDVIACQQILKGENIFESQMWPLTF